jgi:hypothetical protein
LIILEAASAFESSLKTWMFVESLLKKKIIFFCWWMPIRVWVWYTLLTWVSFVVSAIGGQ